MDVSIKHSVRYYFAKRYTVMSVLSSMRYLASPEDTTPLWAALIFMPFGLFFDFMDGRVARWRKKSSLMGQELDSLADLVVSQSKYKGILKRC